MRFTRLALAALMSSCANEPVLPSGASTLTLSGDITRADHQTYRELPFSVPPGARRIIIDFAYEKDNRTVIDLGVRDPQGQRGWSGGNKSHIEIGEDDATPSYAPGRIQPGEWRLVLGIPNIREGQSAHFEARIAFSAASGVAQASPPAPRTPPPARPPGWFRGDFHVHTAHSDGACEDAGARGPCPAINTFEAARAAGLDFVAVTDHNTITQLADIRAHQPMFPTTLLIPGMEITTFHGHANAIGVTDFVDFQLGSPRLPTLAALFAELDAQDAILSVNHPGLPSGEVCMGCGWTAKDTDWRRVSAIEAVNGSTLRTGGAEGPTSGIRFWDSLLKQGYRLTAIGGSDNHDATDRDGARQSPVGAPASVVYAGGLSTKAIVEGVRSGRVFIDVAGLPGALIDLTARRPDQEVHMGGVLYLAPGEVAGLEIVRANLDPRVSIEFVTHNTQVTAPGATPGSQSGFSLALAPGASAGWVRINVRDQDKKLLLLGNPLYVRAR